jgi:hypothetical protein
MITPAAAGPRPCITAGRSMPSIPLAASNWSASTIAGNQAEYAG